MATGKSTDTPTIIIGTPAVPGGGVTATGTLQSIGADLSQIMAAASGMFQPNGPRIIELSMALLTQTYLGLVPQLNSDPSKGPIVTQAMADQAWATINENQQLLNQFASWCRKEGYGVLIDASLDLPPDPYDGSPVPPHYWAWNWDFQGLPGAVAAGLPIVAVADVDEPDWSVPSAEFAQTAQYVALAVAEIVKYYPNITLTQWVGGSDVSIDALFWTTYNTLAKSLNLPGFSYIEADSYGNSPWLQSQSPARTEALYTSLASAVQAAGMKLTVEIDGMLENLTGPAWTARAEARIPVVARLPSVAVLDINSWVFGQPNTLTPVNAVGSLSNAAAEIQAIYPLYRQGNISASSGALTLSSSQAFVEVGVYTSIGNVSINMSALDVTTQTRVAIVIIDQTGLLRATAFGGGTVTGVGTTTLVLVGNSSEINAELKTLQIYEPVSGPDTVDFEAFGTDGRISNAQDYIVAGQGNGSNAIQTTSFTPATLNGTLAQPWKSAAVMSNGTIMVSQVLTWNTTTLNPAGIGQVVKLVPAHLPSSEVSVSFGSNPISPSGSNWNFFPFAPTKFIAQLAVQTTTLTFSPITGVLLSSDDRFLPLASMTGGASPMGLANGGDQITYMNTGSNPNWQSAWGAQFSAATLTYGSYAGHTQLLEEVFQGDESDSFVTVDNIYDPATGRMWEQFMTTRPPTSVGGVPSKYPTGLMTVTEFNTGDNPHWDSPDWGINPQITIYFQDGYTLSTDLRPPPPMITAISQSTAVDYSLFYSPSALGAFTLSGFGGAGDGIAIGINGSAMGTTIVAGNGLWRYSLPTITTPGTYKLTVNQTVVQGNGVTAVSADTTALLLVGLSFAAVAADVSAYFDSLQNLVVAGQLRSIIVRDGRTSALSLTMSQIGTDSLALGMIIGPYAIAATGVAAGNAKSLIGQNHVSSVAVLDTMANVVANFDTLATLATSGMLGPIILTDSAVSTVALSSTQLATDGAVLAAFASPYLLTITDSSLGAITGTVTSTKFQAGGNLEVTLTGACRTASPSCSLVFAANGRLSQEWDSRSDGGYVFTAYDVTETQHWSSYVQMVNGRNLLVSLDYAMHSGQQYRRIVEVFGADGSQTSEIDYFWAGGTLTISGSQRTVTAASAADAVRFAGDTRVVSVTVFDTAAAVSAALRGIQALASTGRLTAVTLTDSDVPRLTMTAAQYYAIQTTLSKITSPYALALTDASMVDAARLASDTRVAMVTLSDTSINLWGDLRTLKLLATAGRLASVTMTDSGNPAFSTTLALLNADFWVIEHATNLRNITANTVHSGGAASRNFTIDAAGRAIAQSGRQIGPDGTVTDLYWGINDGLSQISKELSNVQAVEINTFYSGQEDITFGTTSGWWYFKDTILATTVPKAPRAPISFIYAPFVSTQGITTIMGSSDPVEFVIGNQVNSSLIVLDIILGFKPTTDILALPLSAYGRVPVLNDEPFLGQAYGVLVEGHGVSVFLKDIHRSDLADRNFVSI